jgi:hypothetical protein
VSPDVTPLVDFLLARITEEEAAIARASSAPRRRTGDRRALAGCQARRAIVTLCSDEGAPIYCRVILTLLALPDADHAQYVNLWRPT